MLETNHVRAALLKSLLLFFNQYTNNIQVKNVTELHTHLLAGQSMCWGNDKKERRKRACCFAQTNPYQQKPGRERQSMCYDEKMKWATLHTALTTLPVKKQTKQNWPQAICQLVQPTYQCNDNLRLQHQSSQPALTPRAARTDRLDTTGLNVAEQGTSRAVTATRANPGITPSWRGSIPAFQPGRHLNLLHNRFKLRSLRINSSCCSALTGTWGEGAPVRDRRH